MPGEDIRTVSDIGNPEDIEYAITWRPVSGSLQNLPNLKVIFMTSAGVDAIMHDDTLPDVPIIRNTDPHLAAGIREYVVYHVLHYHRFFDRYALQQPQKTWKQYPQLISSTRTIGIMGLGEMGLPAAKALVALGFKVRSWTSTAKQIEDVQSFFGDDQRNEFLSGCDMLINILPLTDKTRGILNADLFAQLPKGAIVINIGRGLHLNEQDLMDALDKDHLSAAVLDVFPEEPLVETSTLWSHPKIKLTPHIASLTEYKNICSNVLSLIAKFENGEQLQNIVDRKRQY